MEVRYGDHTKCSDGKCLLMCLYVHDFSSKVVTGFDLRVIKIMSYIVKKISSSQSGKRCPDWSEMSQE